MNAGTATRVHRLLLVVLFMLTACTTVPAPFGETPPQASQKQVRRLLRVSERLLPLFPESLCEYFALKPSWKPNATMRRSGTIEITTALMELCQSDDQLAFVMAHELAHESARHARRQLRCLWLQVIAATAAAAVVEKSGSSGTDAALAAGGIFLTSTMLGTLPAMRRMEHEADLAALEAIRRAGYDPVAATAFWKRYASARPARETPEWRSNHPADATRIRVLEAASD